MLARLDDVERARAARFVFARDRWSYAAAHVLLRHVLDQHAEPRSWKFEVDRFGKPRLAPPCGDLSFNLSHTDGIVAVALAWGQEVGVDLERADRNLDELTIADFVLAPSELAEVDCAPDRAVRLLHLWVVKEAVAKAIGRGLSLPFDQIVFHGTPPVLGALPEEFGVAEDWWVQSEWHGEHVAAVAAAGAPSRFDRVEMTLTALLAWSPGGGDRVDGV